MTSGIALTMLVRGARLLVAFAASIVTARALGPAGRGDYFFVVAVTTIIVQLAHLGLASSNTYLVAKRPQLLAPLAMNSAFVAVVAGGGLAVVAVALLIVGGWFDVAPGLLVFAIALAPVTLFYLLGTNLLVGVGRVVLFNVIETGANVSVLVAIVAAVAVLPTAPSVLTASVVSWAAASAVLLRMLVRPGELRFRFDREAFVLGVRYAARAYLVTLLGLLVLRAGVFFVQRLAGSVALGEFSIASQLAEVIGILPGSVALVLFPRLASDLSGSWPLTLRVAAIVGGLLAVTAGVVGALAEPLIALAYGAAFAGSVAQLRLMLPGVVFFGMLSVLSQFIAAVGMPLSIVWAWAAGFVAIVVLCGWLVPLAGAAGAALAVSITYLVLLVLAFGVGFAHRHASA